MFDTHKYNELVVANRVNPSKNSNSKSREHVVQCDWKVEEENNWGKMHNNIKEKWKWGA